MRATLTLTALLLASAASAGPIEDARAALALVPAKEELKPHSPTPPCPNCQCGCTVTGKCTCKDCDHPQLTKTEAEKDMYGGIPPGPYPYPYFPGKTYVGDCCPGGQCSIRSAPVLQAPTYTWYYFADDASQAALLCNGRQIGGYDLVRREYTELKHGKWGRQGAKCPCNPPAAPTYSPCSFGTCGIGGCPGGCSSCGRR